MNNKYLNKIINFFGNQAPSNKVTWNSNFKTIIICSNSGLILSIFLACYLSLKILFIGWNPFELLEPVITNTVPILLIILYGWYLDFCAYCNEKISKKRVK